MTADYKHRITLRAIEMFIAVVEESSVATGARRLGASPSAVSQQIRNLESALGAELIDRSARPLVLTPAGYIFQRRALKMLDEAARAQNELAEIELAGLPQLRLAIIEDFDAHVTPELALRLAGTLPGCNLICHAGLSHENVAALEGRREDIVVATEVVQRAEWIEQHLLMREPFVLAAARGLYQPGDGAIDRLLSVPMVRYTNAQIICQQIENHLRRLRLAPKRQFDFDSTAAVLSTVAKAGSWAITTPLAYFSAPAWHGELELHPLPFKAFNRALWLYARRDVLGQLPSRIARMMRELIAAHAVARIEDGAPWLKGQLQVQGGALD